MRKLYILIPLLFCSVAFAQTNIDLYRIEKDGDRLLSSANFKEAMEAYNKYKIITNGKVDNVLEKKILNIRNYINLFNEAEKEYKSGNYIQSISFFKQYRSLFSGISIQRIDEKIERNLVLIERSNSLKSLAEKDKILLGFEKNFLAEKALISGDFTNASTLYKSAIATVKSVKQRNSVTEQAIIKLNQIERCRYIVAKIGSLTSFKEQIDLYDSYRSNGGVIIKPFEEQILLLRARADNVIVSGTSSVEDMIRLAQSCNVSTLLTYIKNSKQNSYESVSKDSLYNLLDKFQNDITEIRSITTYGDIAQRYQFVFGGYEAALTYTYKIPLVGSYIGNCLRKEYFNLLDAHVKKTIDQDLNLINIRGVVINSKQFAVTNSEKDDINQLIDKINKRIGCESIIQSQQEMLNTIESNIRYCLPELARSNYNKILLNSDGCLTEKLKLQISLMREKIEILENEFIQLNKSKNMIEFHLERSECDEAAAIVENLASMSNCNKNDLDVYISATKANIVECKRMALSNNYISNFNNLLDGINTSSNNFELLDNKVNEAEIILDKLKVITPSDGKFMLDDLEKKLSDVKVAIRKNKRTNYSSLVKPELYFAAMVVNPMIEYAGYSVKTAVSTLGNYEIGLNLKFLKRSRSFNSTIGARFSTNDFIIINNKSDYISEEVKAEYLTGEYKLTTGSSNNSHLFFGLGLGAKFPIKVDYYDYASSITKKTAYFQKNIYVNPHIYSTVSLGYESHKKNLGFSVEIFGRFSGTLVEKESQKSLFPVLNNSSYKFSGYGSSYFNSASISWGLSFTTHLW